MSRRTIVVTVAGAMLLGTAGPAAPPDYPVKFIKVDELKAELDRGGKVHIFDVRGPDEYADLHIKGARSMPLRTLEARALKEVPKSGRVVFY
jgi:3-mercaptopyruvate sulfurtransferase SseA